MRGKASRLGLGLGHGQVSVEIFDRIPYVQRAEGRCPEKKQLGSSQSHFLRMGRRPVFFRVGNPFYFGRFKGKPTGNHLVGASPKNRHGPRMCFGGVEMVQFPACRFSRTDSTTVTHVLGVRASQGGPPYHGCATLPSNRIASLVVSQPTPVASMLGPHMTNFWSCAILNEENGHTAAYFFGQQMVEIIRASNGSETQMAHNWSYGAWVVVLELMAQVSHNENANQSRRRTANPPPKVRRLVTGFLWSVKDQFSEKKKNSLPVIN